QTFADDVAVGDHADQLVVLADRNGADVVVTHQFGDFGDRGVGTDPVDALVHHVFDFHGRPPWLEFGCTRSHAAPVFPSPASIQRICPRGRWVPRVTIANSVTPITARRNRFRQGRAQRAIGARERTSETTMTTRIKKLSALAVAAMLTTVLASGSAFAG